jgi:hypothetical protein
MVVRPKHVAINLNKIVKYYWNSVALDGNPSTWSNTRNRIQTTKFKIINTCLFITWERAPCIHYIEDLESPRAGLDAVKTIIIIK